MIRSKSIVGLLMAGLLTFSVIPVCGCAQESNTAKADSAGAAATTTDSAGTAAATADSAGATATTTDSAGAAATTAATDNSGTAGTQAAQAETRKVYEHDPMENPKAARDIIVNPKAVYGYSPSPESVRLKEFVDALDWTDPTQVAEARAKRIEYHEQEDELYEMLEKMLSEGKSNEEIARALSKRRNELRLEAYKDDPEGLARVKRSNKETYGDENGPSIESLYEKYGSWEKIIEKALSSNPGMDACLGLYDDYYYTYKLEDSATADPDHADPGDGTDTGATTGEAQAADAGATASEAQAADTGATSSDAQTADAEGSKAVTHKVVDGDSLWNLAYKYYKDGSKWKLIYDANKDKISDPEKLTLGTELTIPADQ